jgi:hypothetical protein
MGFGLVVRFIEHLNCNSTNCNAIANSHTLQFITARSKSSQSVYFHQLLPENGTGNMCARCPLHLAFPLPYVYTFIIWLCDNYLKRKSYPAHLRELKTWEINVSLWNTGAMFNNVENRAKRFTNECFVIVPPEDDLKKGQNMWCGF